jgi:hypothetical protein
MDKFPSAKKVLAEVDAKDAEFCLALDAFLQGFSKEAPQGEKFGVGPRRVAEICGMLAVGVILDDLAA